MRLVDASGNIVAEYTYDPYGNILTATGDLAQINPLRYRGYYYDTELGMYYLNSRYYDPKVGRFINADDYVSTGQGILGNNMFAYCGNNPIHNIDSGGNYFFTAVGFITGFIGSAVTTAALNFITGSDGDVFSAGLNGALGGAIAGAGVDVGLVIIGSLGTAVPVVALAGGIAFFAGGMGNVLTTHMTSGGKATEEELDWSFFTGGLMNILSLGLSVSAKANSFSGVSIAGVQQFENNVKSGLGVAAGTGIATEIGIRTSGNIREKRMNNCYKSVLGDTGVL